MNKKEYREFLIECILEFQTKNQFTKEDLNKKRIKSLEYLYDNVK